LAVLMAASLSLAQMGGDRGSSSIELGGGKVTVEYGTPKLGDRNIDDMIKPGMNWRLGSNAATTLDTTAALDFGGKELPAGKYTLTARYNQDKSWTLVASSGTTAALEAPLHFATDNAQQDVLKITLAKAGDGGEIHIAWGTYRLHGSFKPAS